MTGCEATAPGLRSPRQPGHCTLHRMKTSTSTLVSRYIWLLDNISQAGERGLSREDINRLWRGCPYNENHEEEIARKTFYNYKCEIENLFEITIEPVRRDGHFRYRIAGEDSLQRSQVRRLLLNSLSLSEALRSGGDLSESILLEDIPSSGGAALGTILQAIQSGRALCIEHKSFVEGAEARTSVVWPYCVKLREQRWYLLSYKPQEAHDRLYGLDRIRLCTMTDETFDKAAVARYFEQTYGASCAADYFRDYYGVMTDRGIPLMNITVRVYTEQYVNYFRSLPLHPSQTEVRRAAAPQQWCDFAFIIRPTIDFTRKLLSYGAAVQVISPGEYADQVGEMLREAAARYGNAGEIAR